jgi:hypothetical protein
MYVEFANLADPDTIPTNPAIGYGDGIGYFAGLIDSADRDYMRLPVRFSSVETDDADLYPHGHLVRLLARTSGENGIHGKPFSDINNSAVVGGALVAPFDPDDFTRDLIYCRFYFDEADVQLKLATGQISIEYEVNLAL